MAQDVVAHDTIGWQIIERKRQEMGMSKVWPKFPATAASLGLGTSNVNQMNVLDTHLD